MAASRKSPSTERLPSAIADCLGRYLQTGDSLLVGLSGGIDSVVLLHAIRPLHLPVTALHVHHGLSKQADRWTDFCRETCAAWGIPLTVDYVDVERDSADGLEAAARRARHVAYGRMAADWIALGHHRGDRAETMLFNLLRGAGVRGTGSMCERNGRLLRPLLHVGREEILEYATTHGLSWIEDESNADIRYSRNFLRHRILPAIARRFPAAEHRLASTASRFAEAADLLDELAQLDLGEQAPRFPVLVDVLARLSEARGRNILRFLLTSQGVGIPSEERLREALRQFLVAGPDRHPSIAFGHWRLTRRRGWIELDSD
ncbi:MAG TPA: tRNA lysidine(34) synthetase TilS [Rhodocyclaceae bacterium]|nr:tRNA lysidine(34) synthetase TilS [Rhodocyclaceae bacterium]